MKIRSSQRGKKTKKVFASQGTFLKFGHLKFPGTPQTFQLDTELFERTPRYSAGTANKKTSQAFFFKIGVPVCQLGLFYSSGTPHFF